MEDILLLKPNIIIDENKSWHLTLDAWKGFQSRQGAYSSIDKKDKSDGKILVTIEGVHIDYVTVVSEPQIKSITYQVNNSTQIREAILVALMNDYPNIKETYEDDMPDIAETEQYKNHIGLSQLHIMESEKDGISYVGYEFGCDWDDEHGLGIMMHKDKVIAIGIADTSFNSWVTYEDNGTAEEMQLRWHKENSSFKKSKSDEIPSNKPWWKFW